MFDIGFSEIVLVGVVSLVVLGPEKLPGAVRTAALMIGRLKRSFNTLKTEIEKEIGADEIRRQLRNEDIMEKFKQTQTALNNTINSVKEGTEEFRKSVDLESQSAGWSSQGGGPAETAIPGTAPGAVTTETHATPAATPPVVGESASTVASAETLHSPVNTAAANVAPAAGAPASAPAPHTDTASTDKSAS